MSEITRVGVDLAKNALQVLAVDGTGRIITGTEWSPAERFVSGAALAAAQQARL